MMRFSVVSLNKHYPRPPNIIPPPFTACDVIKFRGTFSCPTTHAKRKPKNMNINLNLKTVNVLSEREHHLWHCGTKNTNDVFYTIHKAYYFGVAQRKATSPKAFRYRSPRSSHRSGHRPPSINGLLCK